MMEYRGNIPRLFRNTKVFLAADETRLEDLEEGVRRYLAWQSILVDKETLDLPPHQVRQAESRRTAADSTVAARIGETFQWLLVPTQTEPQSEVEWRAIRLTSQGALAERASKRMRNDELLVTSFAGTLLRMRLDKVPLWRGDHVPVRQLLDDFARYIYLPRLKGPSVLLEAIGNGLSLLLWEQDSFAYADSYDEEAGRYRGLQHGVRGPLSDNDPGLVVPPGSGAGVSWTRRQSRPAELTKGLGQLQSRSPTVRGRGVRASEGESTDPIEQPKSRRYHGSVQLDPTRVGRDAGQIADEVIAHLAGLVGAKVKLTLEIEADIPEGAPEQVVRTVTENSRTLRFNDSGFESE